MWHTSPFSSAAYCGCLQCTSSRLPPLSAYLPPPPTRAPRENAYYIVAVSGGTVLSKQPDGILNRDAVNSDTQRWRVEYEDEAEHENDDDCSSSSTSTTNPRVSFRNVSDNKWLTAFSGSSFGRVDTAEQRQWWTLEQGSSPGSCWLKCGDFADAYLCNASGSQLDGNAVYTKTKQVDRAYAQTWTLRDADAVGFEGRGWRFWVAGKGEGGVDGDFGGLGERERVVGEREERAKGLEELEGGLREREERLVGREAALRKLADELAVREAELRRPQSSGSNTSSSSNSIALLKAENDHLHLQLRTSSLEREVQKVRERSVSFSAEEQLRKLEVEKARLRVLLHTQQQKSRASPSPTKTRDTTSVFNSPSSLATRSPRDSKTPTPGPKQSRLGSPARLISRPATAAPSLTSTPASSQRHYTQASPSTPTRASTSILSPSSGTQKSYDSRFSGWPEDDFYAPSTPSPRAKTIPSFSLGSALSAKNGQARLSKENLLSVGPASQRAASNSNSAQVKGATPGSATSRGLSVSSAGGKVTSRSTPARSQSARTATLKYGAPEGLVPVRDDGESLLYPCGHKVYKPPRKLNKNVVGYLYE